MSTSIRLSAFAGILAGSVVGLGAQQPPLERINLPEGFSIHVYAAGLTNPRSMVLSPNGTLFVGSRITPREIAQGAPPDRGQVYAVLDRDGDQRADDVITLTQGLNAPNGVAFRDGALYVAEINRILRYDDIETRLDDPPDPVVVNDSFPTDWMHGWKFIGFGPDGKLYAPVGAPCNICDREADDPRYASITRMAADSRCSPAGSATQWGTTGTPRPASCGSPATGATALGTTARATRSTTRRDRGFISASRSVTLGTSRTRSLAPSGRVPS